MYIEENRKQWKNLHSQHRFQLMHPSEVVIRFINGNFKPSKGKKILDLGCGTGRHVFYLANEGYETTGIDFSEEGLRFTEQRLSEAGLSATLVNDSIVSMPFKDNSFDGIISISVIYYLTNEDIKKVVNEIYRVLKPGGKAFLVIRTTDDKRFKRGVEVDTNTFKLDTNFTNEQEMTIHFFSEDEVYELFSAFSSVTVGKMKENFSSLDEYDDDFLVTVVK